MRGNLSMGKLLRIDKIDAEKAEARRESEYGEAAYRSYLDKLAADRI